MSSMTDIVFLLLIFFIIVSTMVSPNGLKVLLPKSSAKTTGKQTVSISITDDLQYAINTDIIPFEQLEARLQSTLAGQEKPGVILRADESVDVKYVVRVMEIANRNKYELVLATRAN